MDYHNFFMDKPSDSSQRLGNQNLAFIMKPLKKPRYEHEKMASALESFVNSVRSLSQSCKYAHKLMLET